MVLESLLLYFLCQSALFSNVYFQSISRIMYYAMKPKSVFEFSDDLVFQTYLLSDRDLLVHERIQWAGSLSDQRVLY